MLISPAERIPIARLLYFLACGEQLAHECAKAQAALAPDAYLADAKRYVPDWLTEPTSVSPLPRVQPLSDA